MAATAALATTMVPLSEYLRTSYDPDLEYIDGELKERPVVMSMHGRLQSLLSSWFDRHQEEWNILVGVEVRTQVGPGRIRLPDVVVARAGYWPETLVAPPLLVIEILSPTDSYAATRDKIRDYLAMGIETIWVIDPDTRMAEIHGKLPEVDATRLTVAGSPVYVDLDQLFGRLDQYQRAVPVPPAPAG